MVQVFIKPGHFLYIELLTVGTNRNGTLLGCLYFSLVSLTKSESAVELQAIFIMSATDLFTLPAVLLLTKAEPNFVTSSSTSESSFSFSDSASSNLIHFVSRQSSSFSSLFLCICQVNRLIKLMMESIPKA